jgi:hypothetical protein
MQTECGQTDYKALEEFYNKSEKIKGLSAQEAIEKIIEMVYYQGRWFTIHSFANKGIALKKWITDETHYLLAREGWKWGPDKYWTDSTNAQRQFSKETYNNAKKRVLEAVVKRALSFFKSNKNERMCVSLENYI